MKYILCAYSQIPHEAPSEYFDIITEKFIRNLLKNIHSNPWMKMLLHLSIAEYEYMETKAPELIMLLKELCRNGQIEILASTFNDVILPLIPSHRRVVHIEKSVVYIRKLTGKRPRGFWCTEQYYSPSVISPLSLCGIEYIVISGYSQFCRCQVATSPFITDDYGKSIYVFPFDDRYSVSGADFINGSLDEKQYKESLTKTAESNGKKFCTVAINMDHLLLSQNGSDTFINLYSLFGQGCTLPLQFLDNSEINRLLYIPDGLYGRDLYAGKTGVMLQQIAENPVMRRSYSLVNLLREHIRNIGKTSDVRQHLESLMLKAESSSLYIPEISDIALRSSSRVLCEIESLLHDAGMLPEYVNIDNSKKMEMIAGNRNFICHVMRDGGCISRLVFIPSLYDICSPYEHGMFIDAIKSDISSIKTNLVCEKYDISVIDRKRIDLFTSSPDIEFDKTQINISKRFKIRQSVVSADIEIENNGNRDLKNCVYECVLNLMLYEDCDFSTSDGIKVSEIPCEVKNFSCSSSLLPFSLSFALGSSAMVSVNHVNEKKRGYLGEFDNYHYTQIKIQNKLSLRPSEETTIVIGLRIEKHKESK